MTVCEHIGHRVYTERLLDDGSKHYCLQCLQCLSIVKAPEHENRPLIRRDEIPSGITPRPFIERGDLV